MTLNLTSLLLQLVTLLGRNRDVSISNLRREEWGKPATVISAVCRCFPQPLFSKNGTLSLIRSVARWIPRHLDFFIHCHCLHYVLSRTKAKQNNFISAWCFSDRASWIDYTLITNLMHWLLFIHKILFSSTCFEHQVLIFRRIQLYTCSIWYRHSL